jgi:methylase of polypeptide subunit release factors
MAHSVPAFFNLPLPAAMKLRRLLRPLLFQVWHPLHLYANRKAGHAKVGFLELCTNPNVFNPARHFSSKILANHVANLNLSGARVLDMGTGSGVIGITAALRGARVVAVDVNPHAAALAALNARDHDVAASMRVFCGDLFVPLPASAKFDWIIFNPPFFARAAEHLAQAAYNAGAGFETVTRFLAHARLHLSLEGTVLMILSSDMPLNRLAALFEKFDYRITRCELAQHVFEMFYLVQLRPGR